MHLRSITMKGFKSFPERTRLEFGPGVAVIVGPNGSGKSNVTDAVLWALGEQSPLAIRGQSMQDVIFAGGHGLPSRDAAEVEIVIDNSDGGLASDFSELSIRRRLERSGEGEYRLNGARCRLIDVLEALSDTGLGKEMHSVVSQGRVESIVHSKPRDRRLLIEEAAGLGKYRKRRRRTELKLERTGDNLARALDVEREARSRLRPLRRQAEAAELHERLERQSLEARWALARDAVRASRAELGAAEAAAAEAQRERIEAERLMAAVAERRTAAERAFAEHSRLREAMAGRGFAARSALDRIGLRRERAEESARGATARMARDRAELSQLPAGSELSPELPGGRGRIEELEARLRELDLERAGRLRLELADLERDLTGARERHGRLAGELDSRREAAAAADQAARAARESATRAEGRARSARDAAARAGAELAAANHFLRVAAAAPGDARSLAEELVVDPGYELALAAVLGPRLRAAVVADRGAAEEALDRSKDGGTAIFPPGGDRAAAATKPGQAPGPEAETLLSRVQPSAALAPLASRLLAGVWVVDSLAALPSGFGGVAVTRAGRALFAATGELRQAAPGGDDRLLEERSRRDRLIVASGEAAKAEAQALAEGESHAAAVTAADARREEADAAVRAAAAAAADAEGVIRRLEAALARRRAAPDEGPVALRRAQLEAELVAERRLLERTDLERVARAARQRRLEQRVARDARLAVDAERAVAALERAAAAVSAQAERLALALAADQEAGEGTAEELRACARDEFELQARLRTAGEVVTAAEVAAQRERDRAAEIEGELVRVSERLGLAPEPAGEPLAEDQTADLRSRIDRLGRRREQLGPVNPLAKQEWEEASQHVERLEAQRGDLEAALRQLEQLIRDIDRRIRQSFDETFTSAARNFEELVQHLFPGGRGRLRLVSPAAPRPVLGGQAPAGEPTGPEEPEGPEGFEPGEEAPAEDPGVEVEVTPAGKSTRRLSLLSGGEKSLVALAFIFAVFLARPCPFYILDEVEAALDDLNIDRFLTLVRRYSDRAQFIVVTHQKRTMDAADRLYGVSMGGDGVSKVVSRQMPSPALALAFPGEGSAAAG